MPNVKRIIGGFTVVEGDKVLKVFKGVGSKSRAEKYAINLNQGDAGDIEPSFNEGVEPDPVREKYRGGYRGGASE